MKDVKIFAENVEQGCLDDIEELASNPVNDGKRLRFMPDCHKGVTVPIGTSIPIDITNPDEAISPGTVGCDIGCTVSCAFYDKPVPQDKMAIVENGIRRDIPFGFNINRNSDYDRKELYRRINRNIERLVGFYPDFSPFAVSFHCDEDIIKWLNKIHMNESMFFNSLPSVGGGNHFVEYDENVELGKYAMLVHCGSRNLGQKVFGYYAELAKHEKPPKDEYDAMINDVKSRNTDKAKLKDEIDSVIAAWKTKFINGYLKGDDLKRYLIDVLIAQTYAEYNHVLIHNRLAAIYDRRCGGVMIDRISTTHNYVDYDLGATAGSVNMMIRKGAIRSYVGEQMIIPFNMRDGVAICEGKSNPDWNYTAPHGAGRLMSRSEAFKNLDVSSFASEMANAGIYTTTANKDTLDEAPEAYKNKDDIVRLIEPTAKILYFLYPKMNIKSAEKSSWKNKK